MTTRTQIASPLRLPQTRGPPHRYAIAFIHGGHAEHPDRRRRTTLAGYESGAVDVLYKPLDLGVARAKVRVFLELHRLRCESAMFRHDREANERLRSTVAELEDARVRGESSQRAKDQFLATMSHEIRTPINAIIGYAQIIELGLAGPISEQQRDYLARLDSSSHHLLELVSDVLDLAEIDAAEMDVDHEKAWTGPFVGDERRVRQIILNLVSNAVKFTSRGGSVTVHCDQSAAAPPGSRLHGDGPWTCVNVIDTGIGIAVEDQSAIFEPFHQVERGHTRARGGTGLGLAINPFDAVGRLIERACEISLRSWREASARGGY